MTVWLDRPAWPAHGTLFAHLASDTSVAELHTVAEAAGLHPRAFDGDHYDVPAERWDDALAAGAVECSAKDLMLRLNASGLRLRKRKCDRGLARIRGVCVLGVTYDVDCVISPKALPDDLVQWGAAGVISDAAGHFVAVWAPRRAEWSNPGGAIEPGETPSEAAAREIEEECGLVVTDLVPVAWERFTAPDRVHHLQVYRGSVSTVQPPLRAEREGIPEPRWVDPEGYRQLLSRSALWPVMERLVGIERHFGRLVEPEHP